MAAVHALNRDPSDVTAKEQFEAARSEWRDRSARLRASVDAATDTLALFHAQGLCMNRVQLYKLSGSAS